MRYHLQFLSPISILDGHTPERICTSAELTTKVKTIINECWKAAENKDLGNVKISADGVFARHEEMEIQKVIKFDPLRTVTLQKTFCHGKSLSWRLI